MTTGRIGTSTSIVYLTGPIRKFKSKKYYWCPKCRKEITPGQWIKFTRNRMYCHTSCTKYKGREK